MEILNNVQIQIERHFSTFHVPKGDSDIGMVSNALKSGLINDVSWEDAISR